VVQSREGASEEGFPVDESWKEGAVRSGQEELGGGVDESETSVMVDEFLGDAYGFSWRAAVLMDTMLMQEILGDFLLGSWLNTVTVEVC
jgi:hypothetical protein